jgi:energy-converting hydrogenase A subunit R
LKRVFISDCEGPISKNDNAYELAEKFIPNGAKLFANISRYDDVLADVMRRPGYCAGSTLKLILPFFKAYGVTDQQIEEYSAQSMLLIHGSRDMLGYVQQIADAFIVSTSYEHYIRALCKATGFPYLNTYCTQVRLDKTPITDQEKDRLKELAQEIAQTRLIDIPAGATCSEDFSDCDKIILQRFDEIFWSEIPKMSVGKLYADVTTVGGEQKAEAIRDAAHRLGVHLCDVMYVGDSITDVEALRLVRESGGLAVSFNGNSYAVKNAEVAVLSESNFATALIADLFSRLGTAQTQKVITYWCRAAVEESGASAVLLKQLYTAYPGALPRVEVITKKNMDALIRESSEFRKQVRGVAIGGLG